MAPGTTIRFSAAVVAISTRVHVGLGIALKQAGDLAELTADLVDHVKSRVAHRCHGGGSNQEGIAADKDADERFRIRLQIEVGLLTVTVSTSR